MAFRRRARSFRGRRRRLHWEQDRVINCHQFFNIAKNSTCNELCNQAPQFSSMNLDAFPLLTMTIPFQAAPFRVPSTMATRKMLFGGMKFESLWSLNSANFFDSEDCGQPLAALAFQMTIFEAIVVLPLQQSSFVAPAYIPVLASTAQQSEDLGDRLLWKRLTILRAIGTGFTITPTLDESRYDTAGGQQVVKVRAAVDDRHGIFMVRQFVHDIVFGTDPPCNNGSLGGCIIPLINDLWGTMFYRAQG